MLLSPQPAPGTNVAIDLTHERRCGGMRQPRSLHFSSAMTSVTLISEIGEAHVHTLSAAQIVSFSEALRKTKLATLTTSPRSGAAGSDCTISLHVFLDGKVTNIEESPSSAVNDPAAWQEIQTLIANLSVGKI
ncbi:hypothetical protein BVG81_005660 [Haliangium sp. UPWRP_2]|nr:hypothetical protein BVG81_005660 [Haliangium sp. UPWRP_2]